VASTTRTLAALLQRTGRAFESKQAEAEAASIESDLARRN
jgi:hypothetical protein